jgi:heme/copper-type cytochrome/quinol oxidase subunit 2
MIWNILLIFLVFGAAKKKYNPYASAAILGAVKGVLYFIGSQSVIVAVIGFFIFGGLAAAMVYFLARIDKKEITEDPYPKYGGKKKSGPFLWEYIPLSTIVILLIFGEMLAGMFR